MKKNVEEATAKYLAAVMARLEAELAWGNVRPDHTIVFGTEEYAIVSKELASRKREAMAVRVEAEAAEAKAMSELREAVGLWW